VVTDAVVVVTVGDFVVGEGDVETAGAAALDAVTAAGSARRGVGVDGDAGFKDVAGEGAGAGTDRGGGGDAVVVDAVVVDAVVVDAVVVDAVVVDAVVVDAARGTASSEGAGARGRMRRRMFGGSSGARAGNDDACAGSARLHSVHVAAPVRFFAPQAGQNIVVDVVR